MSDELGCPECGYPSFTLLVEAKQEKASFTLRNGSPSVERAGSVTVTEHDEDRVHCEGCGAVVAQDDLVPVEVES